MHSPLSMRQNAHFPQHRETDTEKTHKEREREGGERECILSMRRNAHFPQNRETDTEKNTKRERERGGGGGTKERVGRENAYSP